MPLNETSATPARRRRVAELEAALLDAALAELLASGYDDLTYEAVAERAQTSRAVLYRRWPSKRELALAAALRLLDSHPVPTPDTGSLRGDVLELLTVANGSRARLGLQLVAQDRKSTRLNSSHVKISYAVFCLKKKKKKTRTIN